MQRKFMLCPGPGRPGDKLDGWLVLFSRGQRTQHAPALSGALRNRGRFPIALTLAVMAGLVLACLGLSRPSTPSCREGRFAVCAFGFGPRIGLKRPAFVMVIREPGSCRCAETHGWPGQARTSPTMTVGRLPRNFAPGYRSTCAACLTRVSTRSAVEGAQLEPDSGL
jgi:hypothetical protein